VLNLVVQRLQDPRWYYLRNLLYLLREIGDHGFALKVRPLFTHPHPKVSAEALRTGLFFRDAVAQRMLMEQLSAREPQVVLHAVTLARMARDPKVVDCLLDLLRRGILDYRFDLKQAIVQTLAEIGAAQAVPVLTGLLQSHRLLHGAAHEDLKYDIVRSFERYPLEQVREPLRQLAALPESDLGRLATEVLGRLEGRNA
jgi:HEAT repeat protein